MSTNLKWYSRGLASLAWLPGKTESSRGVLEPGVAKAA